MHFVHSSTDLNWLEDEHRIWSSNLRSIYKIGTILLVRTRPFRIKFITCASFGNPLRLDYGTGHELNFVAFLCCLEKTGIATTEQRSLVALNIFARYTSLIRIIQRHFRYDENSWTFSYILTYRSLEPAGSHGVWGLDDYCFIPFLWYLNLFATFVPS